MQLNEAFQNLQNLINAGLKSGLFSDVNSVMVIQQSLETIRRAIPEQKENGVGVTPPLQREESPVGKRY